MALKPYMGPNLSQLRLETRKIDISGRIQIDGVQYLIPGTDAGTVVDVFIEEEAIRCQATLKRTHQTTLKRTHPFQR